MQSKLPVLGAIEDLDSKWLSEALGQTVSHFDYEQIVGEGYASRMYRLSVKLPDDSPGSLILKLATIDAAQRELEDETVMFREVHFYRDYAAPMTHLEFLPRVYWCGADPNRMELTILMEDIGDIPHKPFRENLENSLAAVSVLAQVHAAYWNSDVLMNDCLAPLESEVTVSDLQKLVLESMEVEARADYSFPYLRKCMGHMHKLVKWLISDADHFSGAMTLAHGDFHARNIHFVNGRAVLFDWQAMERGRPARDLAYWLLTSVDVGDAETFQPRLIDRYLGVLHENGVSYSRKAFDKDFKDAMGQMVPRMYCYQKLVSLSDDDQYVIAEWLARTDRMARELGMLGQLRIGRIIVPPTMFLLRLFGLRKAARAVTQA